MENCFLKKLNTEVVIENPKFFGFLSFELEGDIYLPSIRSTENSKCIIIGDGTKCDSEFNPPATPIKEFNHPNDGSGIYMTGNHYTLWIEKKYLTRLMLSSSSANAELLKFDIGQFMDIKNMSYFSVNVNHWTGNIDVYGNLGDLKNMPALRIIDLYYTNVIGRVEDLIVNMINTGLTTLSGDGFQITCGTKVGRTFNGQTFSSSKFTWEPSGNNYVITRGYGGSGYPSTETITIDKSGNVVSV